MGENKPNDIATAAAIGCCFGTAKIDADKKTQNHTNVQNVAYFKIL
jgi:hypothetical protein